LEMPKSRINLPPELVKPSAVIRRRAEKQVAKKNGVATHRGM
jgi:hypothetical protein